MVSFERRETTRPTKGRTDGGFHFLQRWQARLAACILGTFLGASGYGCGDGEAEEETIACCRIRMICINCVCDDDLEQIGRNGNELACEAAHEDGLSFHSCDGYEREDAILDCS